MNKILRAILIDDEDFCRNDLAEVLANIPDIEITAEASSLKEAVALITKHSPDLIFLDLNLRGDNGFRILSEIPKTPSIIAVTAFSEHAVEGFSLDLADYILKPVEEKRLRQAVHRVRNDILLKSIQAAPLIEMEINGRSSTISLSDILWIKSNQNYVEIHSSRGIGLIRSTFTRLVGGFPSNYTLEISRGRVLARHQINGWHRDSSSRLLVRLKTGEEFPVSKRLQKDVLDYLHLLH